MRIDIFLSKMHRLKGGLDSGLYSGLCVKKILILTFSTASKQAWPYSSAVPLHVQSREEEVGESAFREIE